MKLFDIPGLGRAIGAAAGASRAYDSEGKPTTPGLYLEEQRGRKPNILIPKVGGISRKAMMANIEALVTELGKSDKRMYRLVRKDGFVLEPVVPASVLRVIPDNRNMEGSAYVMSALSRNDFGRDEMGMRSNSVVNKLVYVMPGGSTVSISKNRELSVGERRRLGRLVASASSKKSDTDPLAPIRSRVNVPMVSLVWLGLRCPIKKSRRFCSKRVRRAFCPATCLPSTLAPKTTSMAS